MKCPKCGSNNISIDGVIGKHPNQKVALRCDDCNATNREQGCEHFPCILVRNGYFKKAKWAQCVNDSTLCWWNEVIM